MEDHETPLNGDDELREDPIADPETEDAPEKRAVNGLLEMRQRRAEMLKGTMESRVFPAEALECRTLDDGTLRMGGYASVTERFYNVGDPERGGFQERIARSAFKRTLNEQPDVVLLANHEGLPMARTRNGSLALQEDSRGLRWDADLDGRDPDSAAIARKVDGGLIDQCSFAFKCTDDEWNSDYTERTVKGLSIHRGDVSVVTYGCSEDTSVTTIRSADGSLELRAGKAISSANEAALRHALDLVAAADDAVDKAQPLLAGVLGVANPDADDQEPDADDARATAAPETTTNVARLDYHKRAREQRERLARLRGV